MKSLHIIIRWLVFYQTLTWISATDFHVAVAPVSQQQSFRFETGAGVPGTIVDVEVYDKCRTELSSESEFRTIVGELYPSSSTVQGIAVDHSGVAANPVGGHSNVLSFTFVEGIAQNYDIYHTAATTTAATGKVEFCVQVNLYSGEYLANFAELKLTYNINLKTDIVATQEQIMPNRGPPVTGIASLLVGTVEDSSKVASENSTKLTTETSLNVSRVIGNNVTTAAATTTTTTQTVREDGLFRHLRLTEPPLTISTAKMANQEVEFREYETKTDIYFRSAIMIVFVALLLAIRMVNWSKLPKVKEANPAVAPPAKSSVDETNAVGVARIPIQRIPRKKARRSSTMDETIPSTSSGREKSRLRRSNTALYKHLQQEGMPPH